MVIDLLAFCDTRDDRAYLQKPIRHAGRLYASNGHIAIRVADRADVEASDAQEPQCRKLTDFIDRTLAQGTTAKYVPIPKKLAHPATCMACGGIGKQINPPCPECDGEGSFEHGSHSYKCKACKGRGIQLHHDDRPLDPCPRCRGTGRGYTNARVGSTLFNLEYLLLIRALPGALLAVEASTEARPHLFRFDGGEGVVVSAITYGSSTGI